MAEKRYTRNGEWVVREGTLHRTGLSASSAEELGDVTFVGLPRVGTGAAAGQALCALEAVKAAADFYSPLTGRVAEVNVRLEAEPQLVSTSPEDRGWIAVLEGVSESEWAGLLDEEAWARWRDGR